MENLFTGFALGIVGPALLMFFPMIIFVTVVLITESFRFICAKSIGKEYIPGKYYNTKKPKFRKAT